MEYSSSEQITSPRNDSSAATSRSVANGPLAGTDNCTTSRFGWRSRSASCTKPDLHARTAEQRDRPAPDILEATGRGGSSTAAVPSVTKGLWPR